MKEFSLAKNSGVTTKAPLNPKPSQRQDALNNFFGLL